MRRYYLQSGLWMSVLTVLIFGGLYVAADLNATAPPSNGGAGNQRYDGVTSDTVSGQGTKIASGIFAKGATTTLTCSDFDGDGTVGIPDFLLFLDHFGSSLGDGKYEAKYDLNENDTIGIPDFLIFVDNFGKEVDCGGPDLIVDSPSARDDILIREQSFTLSATVRNQGTGSSVSTTLRYYQSSDATISTSDTEVGMNSVDGLSASGMSDESISLNAPSSAGTYYYGACVESVSGESDTNNNCSEGVSVTVSSGIIADANLRAVIADRLGKASGAMITRADMAKLRRLDAQNKGIRSLTGLEHATNLQRLHLGLGRVNGETVNSNEISNLSPLSKLTKLEYLYLDNNSISDISDVKNLTYLKDLYLQSNSISDISAVSSLTNLRELSFGNNNVSDISDVKNLTNLTSLYLNSNSISDISAVSNLTNLIELSLSSNSISDISAVSSLTNLKWLYLQSNSIEDLSPLVANTGLGRGDEVYVQDNLLSATSINTHIPVLIGRGVTVAFDRSGGGGG